MMKLKTFSFMALACIPLAIANSSMTALPGLALPCAFADETVVAKPTRVISAGWNQPSLAQVARDGQVIDKLPIDGSVISIRTASQPTDLLSVAHSSQAWDAAVFDEAIQTLNSLDREIAQDCYLGINANPGNVDFLDDQGWIQIVDHWRFAAQLVAHGKLRGIALDPEAYTPPHSQFQYSAQRLAASRSFTDYTTAARRRGREVMEAVKDEVPELEILSYFLMSFLVSDRLTMGPSPVNDQGKRRRDFDWCLAGHQYGLLPAFLSGMLEAAGETITFIDGCEYGYWMESASQMNEHARQVRHWGRVIVDRDVRQAYDTNVELAFPVFMDLIAPDILPQWTLSPQESDRQKILRRQLRIAIESGDGLVWLYGERGRWWPEANETAMWEGKDIYPHWTTIVPQCDQVIRSEVKLPSSPRSDNSATDSLDTAHPSSQLPVSLTNFAWTPVEPESKQDVPRIKVNEEQVVITGPVGGAATANFEVVAGKNYRITASVSQTGRGMPRLMIQFQNETGEPISSSRQMPTQPSGDLFYSYPSDGNPSDARVCQLRFRPPASAKSATVYCLVTDAMTPDDKVTFSFPQSEPSKMKVNGETR